VAQNVLVIGELLAGTLAPTSKELLGAASRLAEGGTVGVTLLGTGAQDAANEAFTFGATQALVSSDANYDVFRSDQWVAAAEAAIAQTSPAVVLLAPGGWGQSSRETVRDLAMALARHGLVVFVGDVRLACDGQSPLCGYHYRRRRPTSTR